MQYCLERALSGLACLNLLSVGSLSSNLVVLIQV